MGINKTKKATGETILVCDDKEIILNFCLRILESEGYCVKGIDSGEEAIELAKREHFDLLLVDFVMPGINGLETLKAIREFDPDIVGAVITGHGSFSMAVDALKLGFKGFITKPFTAEELLVAVSEILRQSKLEKEVMAYKQAAKLKDDFLSLVSHELRAPLSLVRSSANLLFELRNEKADEDEKKMLSILRKEIGRLAKIISDLLIMSERGSTNGEHPPQDSLNLKEITEKIINSLEEDAGAKEISIHNLIPDDIPNINGEKSRIIQLIINLLDNAIKFNRSGGQVHITAGKGENHVRFEIEDTGPGIAKEKISTIFSPFHPLEDPMTRTVRGLGVGLPVSKKVVDAHGGEIWVETKLEKGSRFIFTLPLRNDNLKSKDEGRKN